MFTDQECVKSGRAKADQVLMRAQTRFTHGDTFLRNGFDQFVRRFDSHFERAQVAIVHADDARAGGQRPRQLLTRVHFHQRLHPKLPAQRQQFGKKNVTQSRDNQQKRIRICRARFPNLPGVNNEIFP
jgi:hypothetical protein